MRACRQRRNLTLTLYSNDEVINTMRSLVSVVMHVAACFAYLYILGVDLKNLLLEISSAGLGFAFVFGNSMRAVYDSMIFLFVVRPFQVGDCILYAGERHWVRNFGILTTLLKRFDGCQLWVCLPRLSPRPVALRCKSSRPNTPLPVQVSNDALMKSEIANLSHSDDVVIRSDFVADAGAVTPALCTELEERLLDMMMLPGNAEYFRIDYKPLCNIQQLQEPHKFLVRPQATASHLP